MLCAKNTGFARRLVARRKCKAKSRFHLPKKILERDQYFFNFAVDLSQMDLENVDMRKK